MSTKEELMQYVTILQQKCREQNESFTYSDDFGNCSEGQTITHFASSSGPWQLTDHLFIGTVEHAINPALLQELGIHGLLNCAAQSEDIPVYAKAPTVYSYMHVLADDLPTYAIDEHFVEACQFLKTRATHGVPYKTLVYCRKGVNRSASVCVAYLITCCGMSLTGALEHLISVKWDVFTNTGFLGCLHRYCLDNNMPI